MAQRDRMASPKHSVRRCNKPLMERRRRERINTCLLELKSLVLDAVQDVRKDNTRFSKLEKADVLEMTVNHLKNTHRRQMSVAMSSDNTVTTKYRAGFSQCADEVSRYLGSIEGISPELKVRLLHHLAFCMDGIDSTMTSSPDALQPLHIQIPSETSPHNLPGVPSSDLPGSSNYPALEISGFPVMHDKIHSYLSNHHYPLAWGPEYYSDDDYQIKRENPHSLDYVYERQLHVPVPIKNNTLLYNFHNSYQNFPLKSAVKTESIWRPWFS